jgi:hypothetical protein
MDNIVIEYVKLLKNEYIKESCDYDDGLVIVELEKYIVEKIKANLPHYNKKIRNNPENVDMNKIRILLQDSMKMYIQLIQEGEYFRLGVSVKQLVNSSVSS